MDTKKIKETEKIEDEFLTEVSGGSRNYKYNYGDAVLYKHLDRRDAFNGVTIQTGIINGYDDGYYLIKFKRKIFKVHPNNVIGPA